MNRPRPVCIVHSCPFSSYLSLPHICFAPSSSLSPILALTLICIVSTPLDFSLVRVDEPSKGKRNRIAKGFEARDRCPNCSIARGRSNPSSTSNLGHDATSSQHMVPIRLHIERQKPRKNVTQRFRYAGCPERASTVKHPKNAAGRIARSKLAAGPYMPWRSAGRRKGPRQCLSMGLGKLQLGLWKT